MNLDRHQQETLHNLERILEQRGRAYLLGWLMGVVIRLSQTDPGLRRLIKQRSQDRDGSAG